MSGECVGRIERHHLARGPWRAIIDADPDLQWGATIPLCAAHHGWVTHNPEKAHAVDLAWGPDSERKLRELGWQSKTDVLA